MVSGRSFEGLEEASGLRFVETDRALFIHDLGARPPMRRDRVPRP